jgi:hypothetical protein
VKPWGKNFEEQKTPQNRCKQVFGESPIMSLFKTAYEKVAVTSTPMQ